MMKLVDYMLWLGANNGETNLSGEELNRVGGHLMDTIFEFQEVTNLSFSDGYKSDFEVKCIDRGDDYKFTSHINLQSVALYEYESDNGIEYSVIVIFKELKPSITDDGMLNLSIGKMTF